MAAGKLIHQQYGKARVRVLKVRRDGGRHHLKEIEASVLLEGDFAASYERADNSRVVPTDTMKNTVYALAKDKLGEDIEEFGLDLGRHFLRRYAQVSQATVQLRERPWKRLSVDGAGHPHSFQEDGNARLWSRTVCSRSGETVESGVEDLLILKSTGSGFEHFHKDEFTTLAETRDRILATSMTASWLFGRTPAACAPLNQRILDAMLKVFAVNYSPSVQATLYEMGQAALAAAPEITRVTLAMPNKHCLLVNLAPFGLENRNEVFVPTDEPHGQIEATLERA